MTDMNKIDLKISILKIWRDQKIKCISTTRKEKQRLIFKLFSSNSNTYEVSEEQSHNEILSRFLSIRGKNSDKKNLE